MGATGKRRRKLQRQWTWLFGERVTVLVSPKGKIRHRFGWG
jgi:hypothetical protein